MADKSPQTPEPRRYEDFTANRALGRASRTLEEIAEASSFLALDRASCFAGQILNVDGGLHLS